MPVPQERDFFGSLNTIIKLTESTCEDKWDLLVETALPAAGTALAVLVIPSPEEILENYLQPRGRRGQAKRATQGFGRRQITRAGQLRWWQKIGFPDIDQIIAEHLPGRDFFEGRNAGTPERWFWKGIDILDRGLWYWMLLDIGETFVVEWASGIMESRFCTSSFDARLELTNDIPAGGYGGTAWGTQDEPNVITNLGWQIQNAGQVNRGATGGPVRGAVTLTWHGKNVRVNPGQSFPYHLLITTRSPGGSPVHIAGPTFHITQTSGDLVKVLSINVENNDLLQFRCIAEDFPGAFQDGATVTVSCYTDKE